MTKRKMRLIINEIVKPDERITGAGFVNRLCEKIGEQPTLKKSKPYFKVLKKWLKQEEKRNGEKRPEDIIFEV